MNNKIVILGHGVGVKLVIDSLKKNKSKYEVVCVITHPKEDHNRDLELIEKRKDLYGDYAYNVFNLYKDYNIPLIESADVNNNETINKIKKISPKFIISIGCRNIIRKTFLETFSKRIVNIHTTPLPQYRGAASDSWMILNNEMGKTKYGCMHYIDSGIDTGDIIAKSTYKIPEKAYPIDVFKARMSVFSEIIIKGLKNLDNQNFVAEKQNQSEATTFPRLNTPRDGRIYFEKFTGKEIENFIYAFGYPFEGAHCFLEDKKINILEAQYCTDLTFHSFSIGLIFGKTNKGEYKISVKEGYIIVKKIEVLGKEIKQSSIFRLGKYLN